jgi:hypothetical protein
MRRTGSFRRPFAIGAVVGMAGAVLAVAIPAVADDDAPFISEIHYAGGDDVDFVELEGPEGADVSGWTIGSITRRCHDGTCASG